MLPSLWIRGDNQASQCGTKMILTTFSRRISVCEGAIETFSPNFLCQTASSRAWISSSISRLTKDCFWDYKSLTSVTFESNSKLHRIEEYVFAESGVTTTQVPASVEVLYNRCFAYGKSLTSVTFERCSKLREVAADSFQLSPSLCRIEYPALLSERSRVAVPWGCRPSLSIIDEE
jgi:hypothetical protein